MQYTNPVIKGFYPDPSVCFAEGKYYLVCSSFQFFPGVPLFESCDLVNWKQIGHVLTRPEQVELEKINSSGGVFAPTIRYSDGRFYMVTTNDTTHKHFYVYTDDIYGQWSDPITVDQNGIDPSLYFEDGHAYFMSNGSDDDGVPGVVQCEIDISTGKKLTPSKTIWQGSGGRYLESPHLYKINGSYYIMAAEGGTEYGHMITYGRSDSPWGPFTNYAHNPVLTNRNKAPFIIQGIGHGDLIQDVHGDWHILSLGFRQIHMWQPYHHLGREVFLTPVHFDGDGWFTAGSDGTTDYNYDIKGDFLQEGLRDYNFGTTDWNIDWCFLRHPVRSNYELHTDSAILYGTDVTLDECDTPTFIGIRQRDFDMDLGCLVKADRGEAGITLYMDELQHYDIALRKSATGFEAVLKLNIGGINHIQSSVPVSGGSARLTVKSDSLKYNFYVTDNDSEIFLGSALTKYLSSEVAGGFTGVVIGLYAVGNGNKAEFTDFCCKYN